MRERHFKGYFGAVTDVVSVNGKGIQQRIWSKDHAHSKQDIRKKSSTPLLMILGQGNIKEWLGKTRKKKKKSLWLVWDFYELKAWRTTTYLCQCENRIKN